jgi:mannose-1-phosphate guanylyltransferase
MIVVDTEDALLVCPRERVQEVRDLVEKLRESGREEYL